MIATKNKDKATCAFYLDARDLMTRLDAVVGPENWSVEYTPLVLEPTRWVVECTVTVGGVSRADVGEGEFAKDCYTDSFKRSCVAHGLGRYLYLMPDSGWFAIDEYGHFTEEANRHIAALLRRNLQGGAPAQTPVVDLPAEPAPSPLKVVPRASDPREKQRKALFALLREHGLDYEAQVKGCLPTLFDGKNSLTLLTHHEVDVLMEHVRAGHVQHWLTEQHAGADMEAEA
jgi:hypothetical protein